MPVYTAGSIVKVSEVEPGVYEARQEEEEITLPKPVEGGPQNRHEIDFSFGPVKIVGYVDTTTFEIGVEITVVGIKLGSFYGNLKDGLVIKINLFVVTGEIRFYLKNGNEVWVHIDVQVTFDGSFNKDVKLFSF